MSVARLDDVEDGDCECGRVNQRPHISYAQFKYKLWVTKPNTIKITLPGGDQFTCDLMIDAGNAETYLKWIQVYNRVLGEKKLGMNFDVASCYRETQEGTRRNGEVPQGSQKGNSGTKDGAGT